MLLRLKSIFDCLWFGIMPSFIYEETCHYGDYGWYNHLKLNLGLAWKLITYQENPTYKKATYFR